MNYDKNKVFTIIENENVLRTKTKDELIEIILELNKICKKQNEKVKINNNLLDFMLGKNKKIN